MDYIEDCKDIAEDYADRVALNGANYDAAYEQMLNKCIKQHKEKGEVIDEIDFN